MNRETLVARIEALEVHEKLLLPGDVAIVRHALFYTVQPERPGYSYVGDVARTVASGAEQALDLALRVAAQIDSSSKEKPVNRSLYQVYIYDPEAAKIVHQMVVPARTEDAARLKAAQEAKLPEERDVESYDLVVVELGAVRTKKELKDDE